LRCIELAQLVLAPGMLSFTGANGAGKSSVLEALAILGSGRSFRGGVRAPLIRRGSEAFSVFAQVQSHEKNHRLGFSRNASAWQARVDGSQVTSLVNLVRELPVLVLEPGSHALIEGPSESRRRLFDWLLFHVEPGFSSVATRYQRALQQRNAALKLDGADSRSLASWNQQLADTGIQLSAYRESQWLRLEPKLIAALSLLLPELGPVSVVFNRGWANELTLVDAINERQRVDIARGFSSKGPHRADWSISFALAADRQWLSRGQEKNAYLAYAMAMLMLYREATGKSAILCIDDLWSELDELHQQRCVALAFACVEQFWVTGTQQIDCPAWPGAQLSFHVEHGAISENK
jgi:DNA replication and repair protein RecF